MKNLYITLAVLALGLIALVFVGLVILFAVRPVAAAERPLVAIQAPPSGSQVGLGQDVAVQSISSDPSGIQQVDLLVDGAVVRTNLAPLGQPSSQLALTQNWNANQAGTHILTVRATNNRGMAGESAVSLSIAANSTVVPPTFVAATPIATAIIPTAVPTVGSQDANPGACTYKADFMGDVTVPDGTSVPASTPFVKTWRVKNSGCAWDGSVALVWTGGEQMGGASPTLVPATATGATADISVSLTAPAASGAHIGEWRLRASNGVLFGSKLTVVINVPAPVVTETPTVAPETSTPEPETPTPVTPAPPTPPVAPSNLSAAGTGTTIHFTWTDNSTNELGFRIYKVGDVAPVLVRPSNVGTGGLAYDWGGRPCNLSATYYVKAYNAAGESAASNSNAAVTIPCAPTGFGAVGALASSVNVTFTDNASNETGFRVYRNGSASVLKTLGAHAGTGATSGVVNPVICGQTYSYYVKAYNSAGESAASNVNDGTTFACNVVVTFTSVHVYDDTDPTGAGEIWLTMNVNGQTRRWPGSGTATINSGETKPISGVAVNLNLLRTTALSISVVGKDNDFMFDDNLGTATASYSGALNWSEGARCTESASPHKFKICYNISVTP